MKQNIIAVDFDGTLCENKWPEIGMPNEELIEYLKKRQANGEKLILWTSRNEEQTKEAVEWCKKYGLVFDAVNDNLPEIVDTDEVWSDISDMSGLKGEECNYQCKRMSSLFKYVYADGTVKYRDVDRYQGVNINCPDAPYHSGLIDTVMDELYPITMPYMPADRAFKIYTEDFLVDPAKGDYDTVGILYVITPSMEKVAINRYFKEAPKGFAEIDEAEYKERKEAAKARMEAANGSK